MQNNPGVRLAGKSTAYDYLKSAPDSAWAWEFARRNPRIRGQLAEAGHIASEVRSDGIRTVRVSREKHAAAPPILWASSADDDSARAAVAWNENIAHCALHAVSVPTRVSYGGTVLDLDFISTEKTLLIFADGEQTLIFGDGQRNLQIEIVGAPVTDCVALFVDTKIATGSPKRQLRLLECFHGLRTTGALPQSCFPAHPRCARNAFVLEALDGHLAGKHHRDIAVGLYGHARVDRDWSDPRENMRDTVRRAITRGVATMERGYPNFSR